MGFLNNNEGRHLDYEKKKKRIRQVVLFLVRVVSLCAFLFAATRLFLYFRDYQREKTLDKKIEAITEEAVFDDIAGDLGEKNTNHSKNRKKDQDKTTKKKDTISSGERTEKIGLTDKMKQELLQMNPDYKAWLKISDTSISYPVVQKDNSYYLEHNFERNESYHGAIFLDENCTEDSLALLIYGHHMKDGTMFGGLKSYKTRDYLELHPYLYFDYKGQCGKYQIFAVCLVDLTKKEYFHYEKLPVEEKDMKEYLFHLKSSSFIYKEPYFIENKLEKKKSSNACDTPQIILLSTCDYGSENERLIVVAEKMDQ